MSVKFDLRKAVKASRKRIENKDLISKEISNALTSNELYIDAKIVLLYASLDDEVSTDSIIQKAFDDNKIVALPVCIDGNGLMEFYIINSINDLKIGSFNVREPDNNICKRLENFENAIIIVPALCFDKRGYRLGYGKGYYDRYLEKHNITSIGLCFDALLKDEIPIRSFDMPVNYIITEKQFICCDNGGNNGKYE